MTGSAAGPLAAWEPITEDSEDTVSPTAAAALHDLFDAPGPAPVAGDPLPPLWHWLAFVPSAAQRDLGSDGHPRTGGFLPPVPLPRRMYAGARLEVPGQAAIGEPLRKSSRVTAVSEKSGRSGDLVFVEVTHELRSSGAPAIVEIQDIVYRGPSADAGIPQPPAPPDDEGEWAWHLELATDPTVLFRFSALTYNAHRIHYDRPFATEVEGYPGLVVHGPLQAVAMVELCRRNLPARRLRSFRFRALRPVFDGPPLQVRGRPLDDDVVELAVFDGDGRISMRADAELHPS